MIFPGAAAGRTLPDLARTQLDPLIFVNQNN
jgi:hypothetical protein